MVLGENRWPYDVRAIFEDRDGNLWLGTSGGGLVQLRPHSVHILRAGAGLPDSPATALALDESGQVYVGLRRDGLFAGQATRFEKIGGGGLETPDFISSVCVAHDGSVWAGTLGDGLYGWKNARAIHFTTANGLPDDNIFDVCVDAGGSLWASLGSGGVSRFADGKVTHFGSEAGLTGTPVTTMIPSGGGLLLGTQDGQILREESGRFSRVDQSTNLGGCAILALCEDEQRAALGWHVGRRPGLPDKNCNGHLEHQQRFPSRYRRRRGGRSGQRFMARH